MLKLGTIMRLGTPFPFPALGRQFDLKRNALRSVLSILGPLDLLSADWTLGRPFTWFGALIFTGDQSFH